MVFGIELSVQNILIGIIVTASIIYLFRMAVTTTKTLVMLDQLAPVVFELGRQFKNDSGSSALDIIQKLLQGMHESAEAVRDAKMVSEEFRRNLENMQRQIDLLGVEQRRVVGEMRDAAQTLTTNIIQQGRADVKQLSVGTGIDQAQHGVDETQKGIDQLKGS